MWFVESGPYPVRPGNAVRPLVDGEPAFLRICEAVQAARHSVWVTVTFLWKDFAMPGGHGSFLDVLGRAARRGLDVRVIFWRPGEDLPQHRKNAFWGSARQVEQLRAAGDGIAARWDRSPSGFCQHQKSWLIDAGQETAVGLVGGINQNPHSVVAPGHRGEGHHHDVYAEVTGPATADLHRNFVQRWNGASERDLAGGQQGRGADASLPAPAAVPGPTGPAVVQVQRTMPGETTILEQYRVAIAAARHGIYLENQFLDLPEVLHWLSAAARRGVQVVAVLPGEPEPVRYQPQAWHRAFTDLAARENVTLAGLAGVGGDGARPGVYVHAKLMLADDEWATIGSCNLHAASLLRNAELNVSWLDPAGVRELRCRLFAEHLGEATEGLGAAAACRRFAQVARDNQARRDTGQPFPGLAVRLDPADYARRKLGG